MRRAAGAGDPSARWLPAGGDDGFQPHPPFGHGGIISDAFERARGMKPKEAEAEVARVLAAEIFDSLSKDRKFDPAAYEEALSRL